MVAAIPPFAHARGKVDIVDIGTGTFALPANAKDTIHLPDDASKTNFNTPEFFTSTTQLNAAGKVIAVIRFNASVNPALAGQAVGLLHNGQPQLVYLADSSHTATVADWTITEGAPLGTSYHFTVPGNASDLVLAGTSASVKQYFTAQLDAAQNATTFALRPEFTTRDTLKALADMPAIALQSVSGTNKHHVLLNTVAISPIQLDGQAAPDSLAITVPGLPSKVVLAAVDTGETFDMTAQSVSTKNADGSYTLKLNAVDWDFGALQKYVAMGPSLAVDYRVGSGTTQTTYSRIQLLAVKEAPDTEDPVITMTGAPSMTTYQGSTFTDPGAKWKDNKDGSGAVDIVVSTVDVNKAGSYTIAYYKTDKAGNTGSATRTVIVLPLATPTLAFGQ